MPRVDRSFSHKDIERIFCRNLTSVEMFHVKQFFERGGECEEFEPIEICNILKEQVDLAMKQLTGIFEVLDEAQDIASALNTFLKGVVAFLPKQLKAVVVPAIEVIGAVLDLIDNLAALVDDIRVAIVDGVDRLCKDVLR